MNINFMSIPKTASCSFAAFTEANNMLKVPHDRSQHGFPRRRPELWNCERVMCVLRDPVDRLISAYSYMAKGGTNPSDAEDTWKFLSGYANIEEFVINGGILKAISGQMHFAPQAFWLMQDDFRINIERILAVDFHNIPGSLKRICDDYKDQFGLQYVDVPHHNPSERVTETLSPEAESIVRELYAHDYYLRQILIH